MKRIVIGIILATVACYFWGFLYWGLNPLPYSSWKQTPNDEAAGQALLEHFPESGTYFIPSPQLDEATLTRPAIPSRGAAAKFAAMAGLVAIVMMDFGDSVWWHISWSWKAHMAFYYLSSWVLAATVLFGFTRDPASR